MIRGRTTPYTQFAVPNTTSYAVFVYVLIAPVVYLLLREAWKRWLGSWHLENEQVKRDALKKKAIIARADVAPVLRPLSATHKCTQYSSNPSLGDESSDLMNSSDGSVVSLQPACNCYRISNPLDLCRPNRSVEEGNQIIVQLLQQISRTSPVPVKHMPVTTKAPGEQDLYSPLWKERPFSRVSHFFRNQGLILPEKKIVYNEETLDNIEDSQHVPRAVTHVQQFSTSVTPAWTIASAPDSEEVTDESGNDQQLPREQSPASNGPSSSSSYPITRTGR